MVRIVNTKPHKSVVKKVICDNCGVTLEYVPNDVSTRTIRDYGGGSDTEKYFVCPNCDHTIVLERR